MSNYFRIERVENCAPLDELIRVFAKSNEYIPPEIGSIDNRYGIVMARGEQFLDTILDFEVRKDDVWVITMPKCGTTWMLELVWLLMNKLDYKTALNVEQEERCRFLECCLLAPESNSIIKANNMTSPRVLKSHLPVHMLPKALWTVKPKIIYVARDPKDAAVSYFHFQIALGEPNLNKDTFVNEFLNDKRNYTPFWQHVLEFRKLRNENFVFFTSFEQMKMDLSAVVKKIGDFLKKPINAEDMAPLLDHLSFSKMKNNPTCNHMSEFKLAHAHYGTQDGSFVFVRKGTVGSHKDELSADTIKRFSNWTQRFLKPHGVTLNDILLPDSKLPLDNTV